MKTSFPLKLAAQPTRSIPISARKENKTYWSSLKNRYSPPAAYFESIGRNHAQKVPKNPCGWEQATVGYILENRQYTGCVVNFKSTTVSYKVHKRIQHSEEDYQIIPNMQETIISEEQWLRVQELRKHKRRPTKTGRTSLFSGLFYCYDCKSKMHFVAAKRMKRKQEYFRCSQYKSGRGGMLHALYP